MLALLFAGIAVLVLIPVLLPLLRGTGGSAGRGGYDRAVYRDQLDELEREMVRGQISETDAAGARLEIQRRLLAADRQGEAAPLHRGRSPILAGLLAVVVGGGAAGLYLDLGSPAVPDTPFAARPPAASEAVGGGDHREMQNAAAALAAKLAQSPEDAEGWLLYGRTEAILGDWDKAADAFRHAIALGHSEPEVQAGYGEMLVLQARGIVTPAAEDAFAAALKANPANEVARYYGAVAAGQAGQPQRAIDGLQALAADLSTDNPMRDEIARRMREIAGQGGLPVPTLAPGKPATASAAPGPDEAAMAAAAQLPEAERRQMIAGMVEKLAARLAAEPADLDGWLRLGRAYGVLGTKDKAIEAYEHAAALKPADPQIKLLLAETLLSGLALTEQFPPRAIALLREVQLVAPDEPAVLWYLGVEASRTGHRDEARRYWTRLLAKLPAGQDAEMVKAALAQVQG